uniref:Microneme protein 1 n=1 Tax=Eimeria stiedai TaxID=471275 RepID=A0A6H0C3U3_9EIME|nr:microneme protein 1 [Eimeria stiedai]
MCGSVCIRRACVASLASMMFTRYHVAILGAVMHLGKCQSSRFLLYIIWLSQVPEAGRLQKVLDARCLAKFAKMCSQNDAFCVYAVARKSGSWMCYPLSQLTLTGMSDSCVDDCGNTIPCEGELPENGSNILEAAELTEVVKDLKSGFCMMGVGPQNSALARSMLFTSPQRESWKKSVVSKYVFFCAGKCGLSCFFDARDHEEIDRAQLAAVACALMGLQATNEVLRVIPLIIRRTD